MPSHAAAGARGRAGDSNNADEDDEDDDEDDDEEGGARKSGSFMGTTATFSSCSGKRGTVGGADDNGLVTHGTLFAGWSFSSATEAHNENGRET